MHAITKQAAIDNPESVLNRTADDEPIFVLAGRDQLTPAAIENWIENAERLGVDPGKVEGARAVLAAVREFQDANGAKIPDGEA